MKKFSLTLLTAGLAASLGAFAAVPTDAQPFQLVVPNLQSGIEITIEGLLMRPDLSGDTNFGTTVSPVFANNTLVVNNTIQNQNPSMNMWGFRVGLGYIFANSGNDVQLAWTHLFKTTNTTNVTPAGDQFMTTEFGFLLPGVGSTALGDFLINIPDSAASSSSQTRYDAVDLDVGQYVDIGTRLRMRFFGGLRAAEVRNDVTDNYGFVAVITNPIDFPGDAVTIAGAETDTLNSKFTGIGPRFGVDSSYHISDCFGIVGHFAASLLVGEVSSNTTNAAALGLVATEDGVVVANAAVAATANTGYANNPTRVVPAFDGKLGLDYTYIFRDQSMFSVEAGYQWTDYVNALDTIHNTFLGGQTIATSSIGFDGPYVTLNYKM